MLSPIQSIHEVYSLVFIIVLFEASFIVTFQALVRFQEVTARYTEEKIDVSRVSSIQYEFYNLRYIFYEI